jgi:hypothetical protein
MKSQSIWRFEMNVLVRAKAGSIQENAERLWEQVKIPSPGTVSGHFINL